MIAQDQYCLDILTQLAAVRSALDQVGAELATSHVKTCILGHGTSTEHAHSKPMSPDDLLEELQVTLSRLMR
jgi:DNA-binding FrmR family transcriptional regulator